jgi:hypothetical protein
MADLYALMIGADIGAAPPIIDVTPSAPLRALAAPADPETQRHRLRRMAAELREMDEQEQAKTPPPQPRQRIVRTRR